MRKALLLIFVSTVIAGAQTSPLPPEQRATFHGRMSEPVEPFRIVGNIYYVGARNIASYLITTPQGHILIDSGTKEMHNVIRTNVAKLGFKLQDIKILLSGHAHFDHVQGHAAMKRVTGAKVMALGEDAKALSTGKDNSPLGDEGWESVKVDRVLKDGDTVSLGGTTLRAVWTPGHTPGCTTWTTTVQEKGRPYSIVFQACAGPNEGVKLVGNTLFPTLVEDTLRSFRIQKTLKPDIYLPMHPEAYFAGKVERIKSGETPHPLFDREAYSKLIDETETNFRKRVQEERAELRVYAAAAFRAPLTALAAEYQAASGNKVTLTFDTAGATEQKFLEDSGAALLITTQTLINDGEKNGTLKDGTHYLLGDSLAGFAFSPSSPKPDISTPEKLKAALLAAKHIAFSDPARGATVGIHFMKVIETLGVKDEVLKKSTVAKDGVETMRLVLEEKHDLGVTQISEILQANANAVAGPFPKEFELATTYTLWHRKNISPATKAFVTLITSPATRAKFTQSGIRPAY